MSLKNLGLITWIRIEKKNLDPDPDKTYPDPKHWF